VNPRPNPDPQEFELICNYKRLSLVERTELRCYASKWRGRQVLRWIGSMAIATFILTLVFLAILPGGMVVLPLAVISAYLLVLNSFILFWLIQGVQSRARESSSCRFDSANR